MEPVELEEEEPAPKHETEKESVDARLMKLGSSNKTTEDDTSNY